MPSFAAARASFRFRSSATPALVGKSFEKRSIWERELAKVLARRLRDSPTRDLTARVIVAPRWQPTVSGWVRQSTPRKLETWAETGHDPWKAFSTARTAGTTLKAVQELMGHATIEMTMRYAHLSPHVPRDAVRLLDHGGRLGNGWAKTEKANLTT